MTGLPLVTVGIPVYNKPEGLRHTLTDITSQTYRNLEIIVSINPSPNEEVTREMVAVANSFADTRIRVFLQGYNIGANNNFLFVKEKATGDYFMYACDDDCWHPDFITVLTGALLEDPKRIAAISKLQRVTEDEEVFDEWSSPGFNSGPWPIWYVLNAMKYEQLSYICMGIWKTSAQREYDRDSNSLFGNDILFSVEAAMSEPFVYVDRPLLKKTLDHNKIKSYVKKNPFGYVMVWISLVHKLTFSRNVPLKRKIWIPILACTNAVWVLRGYASQVLFLLPVDHPIRRAIRGFKI